MPSYQKLINGLTDLGLHKMQEHLDYYIKAVNSGEKSFSEAESIIVTENRLKHFLNGVKLTFNLKDGLYKIYDENKNFIGIGSVKNNLLKREIIL